MAAGTFSDAAVGAFVEFVASQPDFVHVAEADLTCDTTRDELGIGSLDIIMLMVTYIAQRAGDRVSIRPEWVPRLDTVGDIAAVMHEIDESAKVG